MNAPERPKAAAVRTSDHKGGGFLLGLTAYALWGVLPIYFKIVEALPAPDVVAHRVVWSLPVLAVLIGLTRSGAKLKATLAQPRTIGMLGITALLIGGNWLLYVHAVTSGHILAASLVII